MKIAINYLLYETKNKSTPDSIIQTTIEVVQIRMADTVVPISSESSLGTSYTELEDLRTQQRWGS